MTVVSPFVDLTFPISILSSLHRWRGLRSLHQTDDDGGKSSYRSHKTNIYLLFVTLMMIMEVSFFITLTTPKSIFSSSLRRCRPLSSLHHTTDDNGSLFLHQSDDADVDTLSITLMMMMEVPSFITLTTTVVIEFHPIVWMKKHSSIETLDRASVESELCRQDERDGLRRVTFESSK